MAMIRQMRMSKQMLGIRAFIVRREKKNSIKEVKQKSVNH